MEYKYKLPIQQIVDLEDGSLKFIGNYFTNNIPQTNDQICVLISDENGSPQKRLYFAVRHFLHYAQAGDKHEILQNNSESIGELQVELLIDEPVLQ